MDWFKSKEYAHGSLFAWCEEVEGRQAHLNAKRVKYHSLYDGRPLEFDISNPYAGASQFAAQARTMFKTGELHWNLGASIIDTVNALICFNQPAAKITTVEGSQELQRKGERLQRAIEAEFQSSDFNAKAALAQRDAQVFGDGWLRFLVEPHGKSHRIAVERVYPGLITVDDAAGRFGQPRIMSHRRWVDRDALAAQFPKADLALEDETAMVLVREAWRLPDSQGKGGVHLIATQSSTLLWEPWTNEWFPFVRISWKPSLAGYFAKSVFDDIDSVLTEINRLTAKLQNAHFLLNNAWVLLEEDCGIPEKFLKNKDAIILKYKKGSPPPQVVTGNGLDPATLNYLQVLVARAYELVGVSQLSAMSQKQTGLDSRPAMRTFLDVESRRFAIPTRAWEGAWEDAARMFIRLARMIAKQDGGYSATYRGEGTVETLKWKELSLEDGQYHLRVEVVNRLADMVAGRMDQVIELLKMGVIDALTAAKLLGQPDVARERALVTAPTREVDRLFELMLDTGEYVEPEEYLDAELALKRGVLHMNLAATNGVEPERLQLLEKFMNQVVANLNEADAQAKAEQQGPMPGAPMPGPQAPPPMAPLKEGPLGGLMQPG